MKLSEKKKKEIDAVVSTAFLEALKNNPMKYSSGSDWWESPPDTWNSEETRMFDALSEHGMKIREGIIALFEG
jgi:hypothetical protein